MLAKLAPGPIPLSEARTRLQARGELKADVCIIGGGVTGIATAYALSKRQIECVVLEAARVGAGGTGASGGQLLVGTAPDTQQLERRYGFDTTRFLWDLSIEGLAKTKALAQTDGAPCHFKRGHLSVAETRRESNALSARTEYRAVRLNYSSEQVLSVSELKDHIESPRYRTGVFDPNEAYLDPGAFVSNLAQTAERQGATVFEASPVLSIDKKWRRIHLKNASVKAQHIILSTGPWIGKLDPRLLRYISSVYVYTGCFKPRDHSTIFDLLPSSAAVNDSRHISTFFKPLPTGGLYLGGPCTVRPLQGAASELVSLMTQIFPHGSQWDCVDVRRGVLCVSRDQLPVCGREDDRVFWAGGYTGHGLTWAIIIADLIAESLMGDSTRFDQVAALGHRAIEPFAPIRPLITPLGLAFLKILDRRHRQ